MLCCASTSSRIRRASAPAPLLLLPAACAASPRFLAFCRLAFSRRLAQVSAFRLCSAPLAFRACLSCVVWRWARIAPLLFDGHFARLSARSACEHSFCAFRCYCTSVQLRSCRAVWPIESRISRSSVLQSNRKRIKFVVFCIQRPRILNSTRTVPQERTEIHACACGQPDVRWEADRMAL
jgi:hypothetical protein